MGTSEYQNRIDGVPRHHGYIELRARGSKISFKIAVMRVNCRHTKGQIRFKMTRVFWIT